MGIALIHEAMSPQWAGLSPFSRLVLVHMATTALDKPNATGDASRLYFAGHGPICLFVAGVGEEAGSAYDSALRRVRRAMKELIEAGAIKVVRASTNGRRAIYAITTSALPLPVDNSPLEGGEDIPKVSVE